MFNNRRLVYKTKSNIRLKNNFTNEVTRGDIVDEEYIDGKQFYVVRVGPRLIKLSKDGHTLLRTS